MTEKNTKRYRVKLPKVEYHIAKRLIDDPEGYDLWEGPISRLSHAKKVLTDLYDEKVFFVVKVFLQRCL